MNIVNGQAIKELREIRGWAQRDLATAAGVNQSVLSRVERNLQDDVMVSVIGALADALQVPIDTLTNRGFTSTPNLIPELVVLIEMVANQPEEIQRQIGGVIRGYLTTMPHKEESS